MDFMKKLLVLLSFIFASIAMNAVEARTGPFHNYTPPATSGIVWVTVNPALSGDLYVADFTVTWGSYQKRFSGLQKRGPGPFVIAFSHFDNSSYNFNVTINQNVWGTYIGSVVDVVQGPQPTYAGQTLLYCGSTIQC